MTEAEWARCQDPDLLLHLVPEPSPRKLVLFATACRRLVAALLDPDCLAEVQVQERYADGLATAQEVVEAREVYGGPDSGASPEPDAFLWATGLAEEAAEDGAYLMAGNTPDILNVEEDPWYVACEKLRAAQADLVREIFGNPFSPVSPTPAWRTATVLSLAQAAYEERLFPSGELDPARLAVLSDALEDVDCTETALLGHLRSPGPHVRGCWALDLILGKG